MSEEQQRVTCPECRKPDVLVNGDGSLRKHRCQPVAPPESPVERPAVEAPPERPVTAEAEPLSTTTAAPAPLATTTRRRRYCRVANCGRPPRDDGLCNSHRLHTHLIR